MKDEKTTKSEEPKVLHQDVAQMETSDSAVERAVHRFVGEFVHNSPISAIPEVYNYLMAKLPTLSHLIEEEMGK